MSEQQLASISDVEAVLGRALTPTESDRADAVLDKASALFRFYSGQQFTPDTSRVWLTSRRGVVTLPQCPVVTVDRVEDSAGNALTYTLEGNTVRVAGQPDGQVVVEYTHGAGSVPELVRLTVADVAQKVLTIPEAAQAGVQQKTETTGPFSETFSYAAWTLGGQASFSPDDRRIAEAYRVRPGGTIRVSTVR